MAIKTFIYKNIIFNISLLIFLSLSFLSCDKEEEYVGLSEFEQPIVTGYYKRNDVGNNMGVYGSSNKPNVYLGDGTNMYDSRYYFLAFPNPVVEKFNVHVKSPTSSVKTLWVTKAQYVGEENYNQYFDGGMINVNVGSSPVIQLEFTSESQVIDISQLQDGFYKVYLKVDGELLHDNLLIIKNE